MNVNELKTMKVSELQKIAKDLKIDNLSGLKKQDLIMKIMESESQKDGLVFGEGVLKYFRTDSAFCARPTITICRSRMIFMFRLPDTQV